MLLKGGGGVDRISGGAPSGEVHRGTTCEDAPGPADHVENEIAWRARAKQVQGWEDLDFASTRLANSRPLARSPGNCSLSKQGQNNDQDSARTRLANSVLPAPLPISLRPPELAHNLKIAVGRKKGPVVLLAEDSAIKLVSSEKKVASKGTPEPQFAKSVRPLSDSAASKKVKAALGLQVFVFPS